MQNRTLNYDATTSLLNIFHLKQFLNHHFTYFYLYAAYLLYSTSSAINRVELDGSQRTTVTSSGTRGVRALDFDIRYKLLAEYNDLEIVELILSHGSISFKFVCLHDWLIDTCLVIEPCML